MSLINTQVQPFKTEAFHNGKFVTVTDETLKGKWSVLIFMPAAFTFNCPTEVEDAADNYAEFQKLGAEVYIVTTDTHFSHKVWHETSPAVGKAKFPLVGDPTHALTNAFDVHIPEEGLALRGTFIINPEGIIKTAEVHSNEIAPRRQGNAAQAQGRPVHRRAPGRSLPRQVERRREDHRAVARPRRQDLTRSTVTGARCPEAAASGPAADPLPDLSDGWRSAGATAVHRLRHCHVIGRSSHA